jgi:hypothetical protein
MLKKPASTRVQFLGAHAPHEDMLCIRGTPEALLGSGTEFTRIMFIKGERWSRHDIEADIVGMCLAPHGNENRWWFAGKRGDIHVIGPTHKEVHHIADAGTGPRKYGHLRALKNIHGRLFTCGLGRQVYEHTQTGWVHRDEGILCGRGDLAHSLADLAGTPDGTLCAVGFRGEIALRVAGKWTLCESPTQLDLQSVCVGPDQRFWIAGDQGIVLCGDKNGFRIVCQAKTPTDDSMDLKNITTYQDHVVDRQLQPFENPRAPRHVGAHLASAGNTMWSIGPNRVFALRDGQWRESICPDNR